MTAEKKSETKKDKVSEEISDYIAEINPEALTADGLESALIGYVQIFNRYIALYDRERCITALEKEGMTEEEAEEFFEYNTVGAYVGENTPGFATIMRPCEKCQGGTK